MPEVWAVIIGTIVVLIVYGILSSKMRSRRQREARQKMLPFVEETIRVGQTYHVCLSDGRRFENVEIVGTNDPAAGQLAFGGWDGLLVLKQATGKRIFVRQTAVRCLEEI